MLEESQSAGTKTIMMLENQGEDLNRVESGLDSINADMKEADKHLDKTDVKTLGARAKIF